MDVSDAVRTVRAIRSFRDTPIPDELVREIVGAARLTASSMNKQPWHFVVVQDRQTLTRMGELAKTGPYIAQAPLAIAAAFEKDSPFGLSDVSRAVQDMVLVAWAHGVGSNWVGFGNLDEIAQLLGIPDTHQLQAVVPFGYPATGPSGGKKQRKALGEVISRERFGEAYT